MNPCKVLPSFSLRADTHWAVSRFQNILCKPKRWLCGGNPSRAAGSEILWAAYGTSHLNQLSSPLSCSVWISASGLGHTHLPKPVELLLTSSWTGTASEVVGECIFSFFPVILKSSPIPNSNPTSRKPQRTHSSQLTAIICPKYKYNETFQDWKQD